MAELIDGKHIAEELRSQIRSEVEALAGKVGRKPSLAVIIVGDDPASRIYVRNKVKAAAYVGMESVLIELSDTISEKELLLQIEKLNNDPSVDGILVQLPLPGHISKDKVIDAISLSKDVDGFHLQNAGSLWLGRRCTLPCTPRGIIHLIKSTGTVIEGKNAVVVGRSNIVGKPVAKLLMDENATVTVAHSHTRDLGSVTRNADILVVAVGHKGLISADMIKPGAVVIDVGMNRGEDGTLCGDVDFEKAKEVAGFITPVPGGVGPMTITMLLKNTVECYKAINGAE